MSYYIVVETNIRSDTWIPEYTDKVPALIAEYGGQYLAMTPEVKLIEGESPAAYVVVIARFPSQEAFYAFYDSDAYEPYKLARQAGASSRILLLPGLEEPNVIER